MACLNMQMNDQQQGSFLGPRISFSTDFVDTQQTTSNLKNNNTTYTEAPVSSEFEFSVPCFTSNSADELFFKTKILPLKQKLNVTTLRDELLTANDDDDDIFFPKSSAWWRFGKTQNQSQCLNVNHNVSLAVRKGDHKNHGGLDTIDERK